MLPALLGRLAPARLGPGAGEEVARMFNLVAGGWMLVAGAYAAVLAIRMRRGLAD